MWWSGRGCVFVWGVFERHIKFVNDEERVVYVSKLIDIPEGTDIIDVKKKMNRMLSVARNESKPTTCILCGKPKTSFCNSHSVPQA